MKKEKLKLIDAYIFAKKMNILASSLCEENNSEYVKNFVFYTKKLSTSFLKNCEEKIRRANIYDGSFLYLRSELRVMQVNGLSKDAKLNILCSMSQNLKEYSSIFNCP